MIILIGESTNRCTGTCVIASTVDTAIKSMIGRVIRSVVFKHIIIMQHASIFSRRFPRRLIIRFFSFFPKPVKGEAPKTENQCLFKRTINKYCNCKKHQRKQKYFYFPLLLHSNFFNIFNHNFRHRSSRFIHLRCLKHRGIQQAKQDKISFFIYKQDRKNSDQSP
jgi:hypothetical protein